jgi:hypothetical protein
MESDQMHMTGIYNNDQRSIVKRQLHVVCFAALSTAATTSRLMSLANQDRPIQIEHILTLHSCVLQDTISRGQQHGDNDIMNLSIEQGFTTLDCCAL